MTDGSYTDSELDAYLDEELGAEEMAAIERQLRQDSELGKRLADILGRRDAGMHSLGAIWRRHRISCPTREQLGSFLLEALDPEHHAYVQFHLETIACRYCRANLEDLRSHLQSGAASDEVRRRRYYQSSVGKLKPRPGR
jgi:hypothetical protein